MTETGAFEAELSGYARRMNVDPGAPSLLGFGRVRERFLSFVSRHEARWELGMAVLAIAFVVVGFLTEEPGASRIYGTVDVALTVVFIAEFGSRFLASFDRRSYLRGHWIDLVALVPSVRGIRVLRVLRLLRLVRAFTGVFRFVSQIERLALHRGLAWLVVAWLGVMVICSVALYVAENGTNAAITSPLDALWWGVVTLTTVGYGDVYPVTPEGRIAATVLMLLGIGLFGGITATVTSYLIESGRESASGITIVAELEALVDMHGRGDLTESEFASAKARVLKTVEQPDIARG